MSNVAHPHSHPSKARRLLPWAGALGLGLALAALKLGGPSSVPDPAPIPLSRSVAPSAGWQVQLAPSLLPPEDFALWKEPLRTLLGPEVGGAFETSGTGWSLTRADGSPGVLEALPAGGQAGPGEGSLFPGPPLATFAWARGGWAVEGELYRSPVDPRLLVGPLRLTLPSGWSSSRAEGFTQADLNRWPSELQRLVMLDSSLLKLSQAQRSKMLEDWVRWEFDLEQDLLNLLGPWVGYVRWSEQPLFAFSIKDPAQAEATIERRFPASVVRGQAARHQGSRIRAFGEDGPAWFLRGSTLWARKSGGVEGLKPLLDALLADPRPASPLFDELRRLAGSQQRWQAALLLDDRKAPARWGALLRWSDSPTSAEGCLVLSLDPSTGRSANP